MRSLRSLAVAVGFSAFTLGCTAEPEDLGEDFAPELATEELDDAKADALETLPIRFMSREVFVPSALIRSETKRVYRTAAELGAANIDNPGVDFSKEWAVLYSPGTTRADLQVRGWRSRIDRVSVSSTGLTLIVKTSVEHNGSCADRRTRPFLLIAVPIPDALPRLQRFYKSEYTRRCN